jgi:hypothetical protein
MSLSLVIFLSKRDFITIFFKSFDFSVDSFAFSTKIGEKMKTHYKSQQQKTTTYH